MLELVRIKKTVDYKVIQKYSQSRAYSAFVVIYSKGALFNKSKKDNAEKTEKQDVSNKVFVGYTTSKKIGNAVERNRARRRLKAAVHDIFKEDLTFKAGFKIVFIARRSVLDINFEVLKNDIKDSLQKASNNLH